MSRAVASNAAPPGPRVLVVEVTMVALKVAWSLLPHPGTRNARSGKVAVVDSAG